MSGPGGSGHPPLDAARPVSPQRGEIARACSPPSGGSTREAGEGGPADPFSKDDALTKRLAAIEAAALRVYAAHGLPTTPGHYRRGPRAKAWTFLGSDLTPAQRFALVLERPPEKGWRYGTLDRLGADETAADLAEAARHLSLCRTLRERRAAGEIDDAVLLAALDLTPPRTVRPRPARPPSPRPAAPASGRGRPGPRSGS